jgi:hypothetical protein
MVKNIKFNLKEVVLKNKMIEVIKHTFGFCGEHWHPNIFTILISGLGLTPAFHYIKYRIKSYGKN